jgi:hypothetical protein
MKLFEYKPTEYVDVYPNLPLEWMQKEIDKTQTKYDTKLGAVNDLNKQFADMQAGAQTQEELKAVNDLYSKKINDMVTGLTGTGYIPQTSAELAKFITDVSIDPKVKQIKDDRAAYEIYLKNKLNPQYAGAYDMMQHWDKAKHGYDLSFYNLLPEENSVAELEQTVNKLKPNSTDGGKTFSFYDPIEKRMVQSTDKYKIEELSAERIKKLRGDYYTNWVKNPKSLFHKTKLSKNNLDIYNTPEGKKIYDDLTEYLQSYAYTDYQDLQDENPYNNNNRPTKPGGDGTTNPEAQATFIPELSQPYGEENGLGLIHNNQNEYVNSQYSMDENLKNIDQENLIIARQMAVIKNDPNKKAEYDQLLGKYMQNNERKNIDIAWRKYIEKELYGVVSSKQDLINAEIATFGNQPGFPEVTKENYGVDYTFVRKGNRYYLKYLKGVPGMFGMVKPPGYELEIGDVTTRLKGAGPRTLEEKLLANLPPDQQEVYKRYQTYNASSTTGKSYVVNGPKNKEAAIAIFNGLQSSGRPPKNTMTDKEVSIDELPRVMEAYKTANGYDLNRISYEILADEKDGLVFVTHLTDSEGKAQGFEWRLEDTPNIRELLGIMLPHQAQLLTAFTEATETLNKSHRRSSGSFKVERYDGTSEKIEFERKPIGDGKFIYQAKKSGEYHSSIDDLIRDESMPINFISDRFKDAYSRLQTAIKNRNTDSYNDAVYEIETLKAVSANMGKQNPRGQLDPLGVKKK